MTILTLSRIVTLHDKLNISLLTLLQNKRYVKSTELYFIIMYLFYKYIFI